MPLTAEEDRNKKQRSEADGQLFQAILSMEGGTPHLPVRIIPCFTPACATCRSRRSPLHMHRHYVNPIDVMHVDTMMAPALVLPTWPALYAHACNTFKALPPSSRCS